MRPIAPVAFSEGPVFIDVLPRLSSSIVITSSQGLVNIVDVSKPGSPSDFYQVCGSRDLPHKSHAYPYQLETTSYITSSAVSPTGAYLAFGDGHGLIHLLTNVHSVDEEQLVPLNGFEGKPVEFAPHRESVAELSDKELVL
jgi:PAB-dependent poly(A)-specific ribonuclease subunit 2